MSATAKTLPLKPSMMKTVRILFTLLTAGLLPSTLTAAVPSPGTYSAELREDLATGATYSPPIPLMVHLNAAQCQDVGDGEFVERDVKQLLVEHMKSGIWEGVTANWQRLEEEISTDNLDIISVDHVDVDSCYLHTTVKIKVEDWLLAEVS